MASGKQTPRQKMIGMMYLVLTAILALNVSREILDAFVVVNNGLQNTRETINLAGQQLYAEFDRRKSNDPNRVTKNWEKAQQVKKRTAELLSYTTALKKRLIKETE